MNAQLTRSPRALVLLACWLGALIATPVLAQDYPTRPIRFYVCCAPGGSADLVTRLIGQKLSERWGQPVVVENRPGAQGTLANDLVAKAPPDGYTMVLLTAGHPISAGLLKNLPYDPVEGFGMVSTVTSYPFVISVPQDSPIRSLADLITRAKAEPGKVTFAVGSPGSGHHLLAELIASEAKIDVLIVNLKGAGQSVVELLGGRIDVMMETATATMGHVKAGKIRPIAVSSGRRHPAMPEVGTFNEVLPGMEFTSWLGVAVAPKTPRPIVDRINRELGAILELPDVRTRLAELGGVPFPSTPEEMRTRIEREIVRWKQVIEMRGIARQ